MNAMERARIYRAAVSDAATRAGLRVTVSHRAGMVIVAPAQSHPMLDALREATPDLAKDIRRKRGHRDKAIIVAELRNARGHEDVGGELKLAVEYPWLLQGIF